MALFRPEFSNFLSSSDTITSKIPKFWTKNHSFLAQTGKSKQLLDVKIVGQVLLPSYFNETH
jgi:hypothetical protein